MEDREFDYLHDLEKKLNETIDRELHYLEDMFVGDSEFEDEDVPAKEPRRAGRPKGIQEKAPRKPKFNVFMDIVERTCSSMLRLNQLDTLLCEYLTNKTNNGKVRSGEIWIEEHSLQRSCTDTTWLQKQHEQVKFEATPTSRRRKLTISEIKSAKISMILIDEQNRNIQSLIQKSDLPQIDKDKFLYWIEHPDTESIEVLKIENETPFYDVVEQGYVRPATFTARLKANDKSTHRLILEGFWNSNNGDTILLMFHNFFDHSKEKYDQYREEIDTFGIPSLEPLEEIIKKVGAKYVLYSKKKDKEGHRKKLGTFSSKAGAQKREKQIQFFKHKKG